MYRGFYTVTTGMIAQQRRTELLANNLANAQTPGFKEDRGTIRSFPDMFLSSIGQQRVPTEQGLNFRGIKPLGQISTGVYMQETLPNFSQGSLLATELSTDIALGDVQMPYNEQTGEFGTVFFRIENANGPGEHYTRNGNFSISTDHYLTTSTGEYVLDSRGQRIFLPDDDFQVNVDGQITIDGAQIAQLGVAYSDAPSTLLKQGNGVFRTANGQALPEAGTVRNQPIAYGMQQGYKEGSNVDVGRTMTEMMSAYRAFEANQKVLQAYDRSMEKAVNEIGRL